MTTKICTDCHRELPLDQFYSKSAKCIDCVKKIRAVHMRLRKEEALQLKEYEKNHPEFRDLGIRLPAVSLLCRTAEKFNALRKLCFQLSGLHKRFIYIIEQEAFIGEILWVKKQICETVDEIKLLIKEMRRAGK